MGRGSRVQTYTLEQRISRNVLKFLRHICLYETNRVYKNLRKSNKHDYSIRINLNSSIYVAPAYNITYLGINLEPHTPNPKPQIPNGKEKEKRKEKEIKSDQQQSHRTPVHHVKKKLCSWIQTEIENAIPLRSLGNRIPGTPKGRKL